MNSKSLVNKSVIKSDLRRYWWLGATFALLLFITTALPTRMVIMNAYMTDLSDRVFATSRFAQSALFSVFPIIGFGVIIPAMLFSYLHHKSAVCEAHKLPLTRGCLYFSHLISAAVLTVAAIVINMLIMFTMVDVQPSYIILWALLSLVYAFVAMTFSAAASMLVGNTAAGIVLPAIVMLLPLFFTGMLSELCTNYLYGYAEYNMLGFLQWVYPDYAHLLKGVIFIYLAAGVLFIILGRVFYKKRALENHSRILAFDGLNPVFMYGLAFCAGLASYAYIREILASDFGQKFSMWVGVPFGIAGIVIARMIIAKTFKPNKLIKPIIVYLAMMGVLYLFFGADITGFEKRMPDIDRIESVNVIDLYGEPDDMYAQRYDTINADDDGPHYLAEGARQKWEMYDEAEIEVVLELHRAIIESGEPDYNDTEYYLPVMYTLSNGRVMKREYRIDRENADVFEKYCAVQDLKTVKGVQFPIITDREMEYLGSNIVNLGIDTWVTPERQTQLLEALKKDVESSTYTDYEFPQAITSAKIKYRMPTLNKDKEPINDKSKWIQSEDTYNIYPSYKNCVALLKSWDLYEKMPSAEQVAQITVQDVNRKPYGQQYNEPERFDKADDKEKIQEILDWIKENSANMSDAEYMTKDTQHFNIAYEPGVGGFGSCDITLPKMPE